MLNKITRRGTLFTLFFIVFLDLLGVGIVIPILAPLFLDGGTIIPTSWTETQKTISLGFLLGFYPIFQFIGAPILGKLSDTHGRKKILAISLFGTFLGYVLFAVGLFTNTLWMLYISRAVDGFTGGNIGVANSAIADLSETETDRTKNFGLIGAAFGLGFIFGPFLGGVLSDPTIVSWFNPVLPFILTSALSLMNIFLVLTKLEETYKPGLVTKISMLTGFQNLIKAYGHPKLRILFAVAFLHALGFAFFVHFFPVFLVQKFAYSTSQIGFLFGYVGIWIAFSHGVFNRIVANYFSSEKVLRIALLCLAISLAIVIIPDQTVWLYIIQPLIALFEGIVFPNTTSLISRLSTDDQQGEVLGITQSLRALADGTAPIISGFILAFGQNIAMITSGVVIMLAWVVFVVGFRKA